MWDGKYTFEKSKIIQGDCLEKMKLIPNGSIDLIVTDPPYKMTKQGNSCRPNYMKSGMGENLFDGELPDTKEWMKLCFDKLKDDAHFYVFTNINSLHEYLDVAKECGFKLHNIISMIKDTKMPNRWYLKYTEFVLFFRKGRAFPINDMTSRDYEFVETPTLKNGKIHISQKPLNFIEKLITNSSKEGEICLDLFSGSGTLAEACLNTNRDFIIIEKNPNDFEKGKERVGKIFKNYGLNPQTLLDAQMQCLYITQKHCCQWRIKSTKDELCRKVYLKYKS